MEDGDIVTVGDGDTCHRQTDEARATDDQDSHAAILPCLDLER